MTARRLLVVSHVCHYQHDGAIHAYGPYAREIDIWADLFPELVIASPVRRGLPPPEALRLDRANIRLWPILETGGETVGAKIWQLVCLPTIILALARAMRAADAVHVRCPGNLGLVGVVLAPLLGKRRVAKFAGQWNGYDTEPWTGRLQRWLLRTWWRAPVLVYGTWPRQPDHVVPMFTSMMSGEQVATAVAAAEAKVITGPLRVLFSGRLAPEKRVHALLDAVRLVLDRGVALEVVLAGDGPERPRLEQQIARLGLADTVTLTGALPFAEAQKWYAWAHCLVLPSEHSEGWPKVVAEAMCHGVVCVAVDHGQVRAMLDGRGVVLATGSAPAIADALTAIAAEPSRFLPMAQGASRWARQYSLEGLRDALARLLSERWNTGISMTEQRR